MKREVITTPGAPTPLAHYCQGVLAGDTLYAAGQIASDYRTGVAPEARQDPAFPYYGSNIQKQARYVLQNLRSVFEAAGCGLEDVVKSQVFLTDLNDFHYFDQVWKEFFPSPPPRTTVQVSALLVPGCRVEIDLIGVRPGADAPRDQRRRDAEPDRALLPGRDGRRHAVCRRADRVRLPDRRAPEARRDPAFPYYASDIERQARYVLTNIRSVYEAAGLSFEDTVKAQVFLTDLADYSHFERVWREFFPASPPRTTIQIGALLVPGCRIEIDLTAVDKRVERTRVGATPGTTVPYGTSAIVAGETVYVAGATPQRPAAASRRRHDRTRRSRTTGPTSRSRHGTCCRSSGRAGSRRQRVAGRREDAVFPHRPRRFLLLRPGLEGVLPFTAAAHDGAGERAPGARLSRRGRRHRRQALTAA